MGDGDKAPLRLKFNPKVRLEFHGATITADAGLLPCRELDDASDKCGAFGLGLTETANQQLQERRSGRNIRHRLVPLLRRIESIVKGYQQKGMRLLFRADAAFAKPEVYEYLEAEGMGYAIRLPANQILQEHIRHLLERSPEGPSSQPIVRYHDPPYPAQSWDLPRRVVARACPELAEGWNGTRPKAPHLSEESYFSGSGSSAVGGPALSTQRHCPLLQWAWHR